MKKSKLLMWLAGLSALLGLALLTVLAPPARINSVVELNQNGPVAYASSDLYASHDGTVNVEVNGPGKVLVAQAPDDDIKKWIGNAAHSELTGLDGSSQVIQTFKDGEKTVPNPDGADLWISQNTGDKALNTEWKNPDPKTKWGLLIASDGTQPAPKSVSLTWANTKGNPFAWPLVGLGLLLAAASMYFKDKESDPLVGELKKSQKADKKLKKNKTSHNETEEDASELGTIRSQVSHPVTADTGIAADSDEVEFLEQDSDAAYQYFHQGEESSEEDYLDDEDVDYDTPLPSRREIRERGEQ